MSCQYLSGKVDVPISTPDAGEAMKKILFEGSQTCSFVTCSMISDRTSHQLSLYWGIGHSDLLDLACMVVIVLPLCLLFDWIQTRCRSQNRR